MSSAAALESPRGAHMEYTFSARLTIHSNVGAPKQHFWIEPWHVMFLSDACLSTIVDEARTPDVDRSVTILICLQEVELLTILKLQLFRIHVYCM